MKFPQPIKAIKTAYAVLIQTLSDLKAAVAANSAATTALDARLSRIEIATAGTHEATTFLQRAEAHRRREAGIRHEF